MWSLQKFQRWLPRLYSLAPYYLGWKYALPPAHAFFEVTYRCNLRCDMCHYLEIIEDTEKNRKFKNELSADQIRKAIAQLPRFSLITFTGGEALMKSDFREILDFAASRHKVHIITNGTLLNESTVDFLMQRRVKSFFRPGVFYLGVSLEGGEVLHDRITQVPGSFAKTTEGLRRLMQARGKARFPMVHLTCVMGRRNVRDLVPLYEYADSLNVNVCNFVLDNPSEYNHYQGYDHTAQLLSPTPPVEEIDSTLLREELARLVALARKLKTHLRFSPNYITVDEIVRYYSNKSSYKDYRCYIPWAKVAMTAYGDVFSCPHVPIGNVETDGGTLPWHSREARNFRQELKREKIFPGCLGCCQSEYVGPSREKPLTSLGVPALELKPEAGPKESVLACGPWKNGTFENTKPSGQELQKTP